MTRTSIILPDALHRRLNMEAKLEGITLSQLARDLLKKSLAKREEAHLKHMYAGLKQLEGIGNPGLKDASITIDEILYGERGAWRGSG